MYTPRGIRTPRRNPIANATATINVQSILFFMTEKHSNFNTRRQQGPACPNASLRFAGFVHFVQLDVLFHLLVLVLINLENLRGPAFHTAPDHTDDNAKRNDEAGNSLDGIGCDRRVNVGVSREGEEEEEEVDPPSR